MLIDGEKWACDACVRGHRVSNCQHSDRPLQHINKKGRPVSQCQHCRGLRKSRSAHVKCDCGDGAHGAGACTHGEKGDGKDASACCCSHGGRCSCALKKEHHLGSVPELGGGRDEGRGRGYAKPRLTAAHSEGTLTVFANGHHKPAHKHNHMSQKCGVPYTIPRPHTVHGNSEMARRSVDSLPATNSVETSHAPSPIKDSILSAQHDVRLVRSEHGSPHPTAACGLDELHGQLPPLDLSFTDFGASAASRSQLELHGVTSVPFDSYFCATPDTDQPILSAGLDAPSVDWSHFDLPLNSHGFSPSYAQPPSYASFDYRGLNGPPMSNASSGEPSEMGDYAPFGNPSPIQPPSLVHNRFPSDSSEVCETDSYRLSGTSSFHGLPQMSMLASGNLESLDIDDYLNGTASSASAYPATEATSDDSHAYGAVERYHLETAEKLPPTSAPADEAYRAASYPVEKASKLAPTSVPREDVSFSLPASDDSSEAPWIPQYSSSPTPHLQEVDASHAVWSS
ncbi:MAG: hypothetical protein M1838_004278 [Thelocarpon superellum]|nr:MAG: hypothetical protein M1838_004278 [Thelocarpon superellum]